MDRKQFIRWVLDGFVVIAIAVGGWLFGRVDRLEESSNRQGARIEAIEKSVGQLNGNIAGLTESIIALTDQQKALVLLATFRSDPWSGRMQVVFQDRLFDLISGSFPDMKHSDMPDVRGIQREYANDLIPEGFLDGGLQ